MSYTPPASPFTVAWVGGDAYAGATWRLTVTWAADPRYLSAPGIEPGTPGEPSAKLGHHFVTVPSIDSGGVGAHFALSPEDYRPAQFILDASWFGADPYAAPLSPLPATWAGIKRVTPAGIYEGDVPAPVVFGDQFISPPGWQSSSFGDPYALFTWQYAPPEWTLNATWVGKLEYTPPDADVVNGWWTLPSESLYVSVVGIDTLEFGSTFIRHAYRELAPAGIGPGSVGTPAVSRPPYQELKPSGIAPGAFGAASVRLNQRYIYTSGFLASTVGGAYQVSWRKFVVPSGFDAARYGTQKVELLNRPLLVTGTAMTRWGTASVQNAQRFLRPTGFNPTALGAGARVAYAVRYIYGTGFDAARYGSPKVANVTFTRTITVPGLHALVWGFARVELWVRYILPPAIQPGLAFGNQTEIWNRNRVITTFGTLFERVGTPALEEVFPNITLRPASIVPGEVGIPAIRNEWQQVWPESWDSLAISNFHEVAIDDFGHLVARPIDPPINQVPAPAIYHYSRFIYTAGWTDWRVGAPAVQFLQRPVVPTGFVASGYGTATLSHSLRRLFVQPIAPGAAGSPTVQNLIRVVFPVGTVMTRFGTVLFGFHRTVVAAGFEAARYGTPHVQDNTQWIEPTGFTGALGQPQVEVNPRVIAAPPLPSPTSFVSTQAHVWNLLQFVATFTDTPETWGPYFGSPIQMQVFNRDRRITGIGHQSSRVSIGAIVENAARVLYPAGIEALRFGQDAFIADAVRTLLPEPIEAPPILRWHSVYNAARVVAPFGAVASAFGTADVLNLNREVKHYSGHIPDSVFGTAFVADAVREITFYAGIWSQEFGHAARVYNLAQYIQPPGFAWPDGTGAHHVEIHFNIIGPVRTVVQTRYGEAWVRNKTPQLYAYGHDSAEFGVTHVRHQFRFVWPSGDRTDLWGKPVVRDRRTWVTVPGFNALRHGLQRVALVQPDLPWPQLIDLDDAGIDPGRVMGPLVWANSLYPEGFLGTRMGSPEVYLQGIRPESIIPAENWSMQFGLVWVNPWFLIQPPGIAPIMPRRTDPGTSFTGDGPTKHRLTPHTIWCTPAPNQAVQNHNDRIWHNMDSQVQPAYTGPRNPWWGRPRVELKNRVVTQSGGNVNNLHTRYGTPRIDLRRRHVYVDGFRALRVGIHELFGGSRDIKVYGFPMHAIGMHQVARYVPPFITQYIRPNGYLAYATGASRVELKNRTVHPSAINPLTPPNPAVSRSPRYIDHAGADFSRFGTHWASHYTRHLAPEGVDALVIWGYSYDQFSWRLRVRQRSLVEPTLGVQGAVGQPAVSSSVRSVEQAGGIWPGGAGRPGFGTFSVVALGGFGFDASAFGDIDRWEAGKVKPHGDDMARPGLPRTGRAVAPAGIGGEFGAARLGRKVYGAGFEGFELGRPAVPMLNPHICGFFPRAVVPHEFVGAQVGAPSVLAA